MSATTVPPQGLAQAGRGGAAGLVAGTWTAADGQALRIVRTHQSTNRSGSVRVDVNGFDMRWRPLWAFRYNGAQLHTPRELSPDFYTAEGILIGAAPVWAAWWSAHS